MLCWRLGGDAPVEGDVFIGLGGAGGERGIGGTGFRFGNFGGSDLVALPKSVSHSSVELMLRLETAPVECVDDTVSNENESSTLSLSWSDPFPKLGSSPFSAAPFPPACREEGFEVDEAPSLPPSEDNETEWNEEVLDA